jgi:transglutaminase-like putative cysteine protease
MNYAIRHITRFFYSAPIHESVMELYMHPRTEGHQRTLGFDVVVMPRAQIHAYRDYLGNTINHFDIPRSHTRLAITAEALIEMRPVPALPEALDVTTWGAIDQETQANDYWEWLMPSRFVQYPDALTHLAQELHAETRQDDPLTLLRRLNTAIYQSFDYASDVTKVDSPIDVALEARKGVCQDFSHIMLGLVRALGIPCRYVSGYLYTGADDQDRSRVGATHAWVEAWLPSLGWIGFDPTNNLLAAERHIRVAIGRDYADVPPTRGVFKGEAETELNVEVLVQQVDDMPIEVEFTLPEPDWSQYDDTQQQQQQQQQ